MAEFGFYGVDDPTTKSYRNTRCLGQSPMVRLPSSKHNPRAPSPRHDAITFQGPLPQWKSRTRCIKGELCEAHATNEHQELHSVSDEWTGRDLIHHRINGELDAVRWIFGGEVLDMDVYRTFGDPSTPSLTNTCGSSGSSSTSYSDAGVLDGLVMLPDYIASENISPHTTNVAKKTVCDKEFEQQIVYHHNSDRVDKLNRPSSTASLDAYSSGILDARRRGLSFSTSPRRSDQSEQRIIADLRASHEPNSLVFMYGERYTPVPSTIERHSRSLRRGSSPVHEELATQSLLSISPTRWFGSPQFSSGNLSSTTEEESTVSSDLEDDISRIDYNTLQPLSELIVKELIHVFFRHRFSPFTQSPESGRTRDGQSQPGTNESSREIFSNFLSTGASRKRKRRSNEHPKSGDENDEDDEERRPAKKLISRPPPKICSTLWACPFSKWKPLSYRKCRQYVLKDVPRVKQHLRRYHERPPYCPVCWETFEDQDNFESHIQGRNCSPRLKRDVEGVTPAQQKQLERRSEKQLSKPEQWYAIYEILFPGQPHPESPYMDSSLSAELLSFEAFMETDGFVIVEQKAREHIPPELMPHRDAIPVFSQVLFQQSIPEILRRYDTARPKDNGPDPQTTTFPDTPPEFNLEELQMYEAAGSQAWSAVDPNLNWQIENSLTDLFGNRGTEVPIDYRPGHWDFEISEAFDMRETTNELAPIEDQGQQEDRRGSN